MSGQRVDTWVLDHAQAYLAEHYQTLPGPALLAKYEDVLAPGALPFAVFERKQMTSLHHDASRRGRPAGERQARKDATGTQRAVYCL